MMNELKSIMILPPMALPNSLVQFYFNRTLTNEEILELEDILMKWTVKDVQKH